MQRGPSQSHTIRISAAALVLLLAFSASACAVQDEAEEEGGTIDAALLRTAIVVSDVAASKRFYSHALGYRVGFDSDITRPGVIEQLQLAPGQTARFVVLHGADTIGDRNVEGAMIGLLYIDNPPLRRMRRPGPATLATGEGILAIVTSDIATVYRRMLELDAKILLPPTRSADGSESELVAYDPDGIRIHVVERHASRK